MEKVNKLSSKTIKILSIVGCIVAVLLIVLPIVCLINVVSDISFKQKGNVFVYNDNMLATPVIVKYRVGKSQEMTLAELDLSDVDKNKLENIGEQEIVLKLNKFEKKVKIRIDKAKFTDDEIRMLMSTRYTQQSHRWYDSNGYDCGFQNLPKGVVAKYGVVERNGKEPNIESYTTECIINTPGEYDVWVKFEKRNFITSKNMYPVNVYDTRFELGEGFTQPENNVIYGKIHNNQDKINFNQIITSYSDKVTVNICSDPVGDEIISETNIPMTIGDNEFYIKMFLNEDIDFNFIYNLCIRRLDMFTITYTIHGVTKIANIEEGEYTREQWEPLLNLEGYTVTKWIENGEEVALDPLKVDRDMSLIAEYKLRDYKITYNLNGGTIEGEKLTYTMEDNDFTLPHPTKQGYTFIGWIGTDVPEREKNVTITKGSTGDREYSAVWRAEEQTITIDESLKAKTSWSLVEDPNQYHYSLPDMAESDTEVIFNYEEFTGYHIKRMYYIANGSSEQVEIELTKPNSRPTAKFTMPNTGITIYSEFDVDSYTITLDYEQYNATLDGTQPPATYTPEDDDIFIPRASKPGHIFLGWRPQFTEDKPDDNYIIRKGTTGDIYLVAEFERDKNSITIAPSTNGKIEITKESNENEKIEIDEVGNIHAKYGAKVAVDIKADPGYYATKLYYIIENTEKHNKIDIAGNQGIFVMPGKNVTIYVEFAPIEYELKIELDGGSLTTSTPTKYNVNEAVDIIEVPTKQGYEFLGWKTIDGEIVQEIHIPVGSTGQKRFIAQWRMA